MILGLQDRNTARVVAARFISRAGGEAAFFVGIWGKAAYEFDATPAQQALVMASLGIFSLIGSALAGVLIDRFDPRRVLIVSEILFVPATLALVLPDNIGDMTLVVAFAGLTTAAVLTAVISLPPFLTTEPARLQRINSASEAGGSAAFVAGPAMGGLIAHYWSLDWIFVLDAFTSVVAVALVARVALRPGATNRERPAGLKEMREGFRFAWRSPPLRLYLGIFAALWLPSELSALSSRSSTATFWGPGPKRSAGSTLFSAQAWSAAPYCSAGCPRAWCAHGSRSWERWQAGSVPSSTPRPQTCEWWCLPRSIGGSSSA